MAEETGSARQEAERLVATVLAMAGRAARSDESLAAAGSRLADGLGALGTDLRMAWDAATRGQNTQDAPAGETPARDAPGQGTPAGDTPAGHTPARDAPGQDTRGRDAHGHDARGQETPGTEPRSRQAHAWATGSAECCVCPVCRAIAATRDPAPEAAARLATGVGDLATGVASMMRAFSALSGSRPKPAGRKPARPEPARRPAPPADPGAAWSAATRSGDAADLPEPTPGVGESPWAAATHAADRERQAAARERAAAARAKAEAAAREQAAAARERAEAARRRVAEAAEAARKAAGSGDPAWTAGPRTGQDVWAAATADPAAPAAPGVDHDGADGDARPDNA